MKVSTAQVEIFFGGWTVFFTGILSCLEHGFRGSGISVFFKDIGAELGISRAITSLAAGIGRLEGGVTSPLTGWLCNTSINGGNSPGFRLSPE